MYSQSTRDEDILLTQRRASSLEQKQRHLHRSQPWFASLKLPSHPLSLTHSTSIYSGALLINCNRSRLWPGKWNGHIYVNHHQSSRIMSFDHHWCQRTSWRCLKSRNLDSAKFVCHQAYNYFYKVTTTKRFLFLNIFTELAFVHVFQNYTCAWCALIRKTGGYHSLNPSSRIIEGQINDYIYEITNSLQHTFS